VFDSVFWPRYVGITVRVSQGELPSYAVDRLLLIIWSRQMLVNDGAPGRKAKTEPAAIECHLAWHFVVEWRTGALCRSDNPGLTPVVIMISSTIFILPTPSQRINPDHSRARQPLGLRGTRIENAPSLTVALAVHSLMFH